MWLTSCRRVDPRADEAGVLPGAAARGFGRVPEPLRHHRPQALRLLLREPEGGAAGRGGEVQLHALGVVVGGQLGDAAQHEVAHVLLRHARAPLAGRDLLGQAGVGAHAQGGDEVHAAVVGAVDEDPQRVEAAVDEALHVVPHPPVGALLEAALHVLAEGQAHLGRVEPAVVAGHAVDEGVDAGVGDLVDGGPGVLQAHGRLVDEEVVVARVVEVDGAALAHWSLLQVTPVFQGPRSRSTKPRWKWRPMR